MVILSGSAPFLHRGRMLKRALISVMTIHEGLQSVFVQYKAWKRVVSCRQPLPYEQHIPSISVALCETTRRFKNAMALFSRAPLNFVLALFIICRVFQVLEVLQEFALMVRVESAQEL